MTPIKRLKTKLTSIADAVRERTDTTDKMSLDEMTEEIEYMPAGEDGNAYILVDEEGNEIPAVLTDEEVDLTATANDIREGAVAVTDDGVVEGTKEIPNYISREGWRLIPNESRFLLPTDGYDYTKLQAIICLYDTSVANSVAAEKVVIDENIYSVRSTEVEATVTKDSNTKSIDFGLINTVGKDCMIRYFTLKEEY